MLEAASQDAALRTRLADAALMAAMRPVGTAGIHGAGGAVVAADEATLLWRSLLA